MTRLSQPILILAGGFGTRLKSLVSEVPKPLAPVGDKAFLFFLIQSLYRQGFRQIDLSLHHDSKKIIDWTQTVAMPDDLVLRYAVEPKPLGTAGAIAFCRDTFSYSEDLFVCNGDTYLNGGASQLLQASKNLNAIGLVEVEDSSRYGSVKILPDGRIAEFNEKSNVQQKGLINSGLYLVRQQFLQQLKNESSSLEKDIFPKMVAQNQLQGVRLQSLFIDIGIPKDYTDFVRMVQNKEVVESW